MLGGVGSTQSIVQATLIRGQTNDIRPRQHIRGEKFGGEGFRGLGQFRKDELLQERTQGFLSGDRIIIGAASALEMPKSAPIGGSAGENFGNVSAFRFGPKEDFQIFGFFFL